MYTFMLPTGEMTMTLEDMYRILRVPLEGEQIIVVTDRVVIHPYMGEEYKTSSL